MSSLMSETVPKGKGEGAARASPCKRERTNAMLW